MPSDLNLSKFRTPKGVPYAIVEGPHQSFDLMGRETARAVYQVFVEHLHLFVAELMPAPFQPSQSSPTIVMPPALGLLNVRPNGGANSETDRDKYAGYLKAEKIESTPLNKEQPIDPFDTDERSASSDAYGLYVLVTVDYGTNFESQWNHQRVSNRPHEILEPSLSVTVEMLSVFPNKQIHAGSAEGTATAVKDLHMPIVQVIPIVERSFRWSWALNPDFAGIYSQLGTVNRSPPLTFIEDAPEETVLFLGMTGKQEYRHNGGRGLIMPWVLEYKFAQRILKVTSGEGDDAVKTTVTWNHVYNPDKGKFERVFRVDATSGNKSPLYATSDFLRLFRAKVTD